MSEHFTITLLDAANAKIEAQAAELQRVVDTYDRTAAQDAIEIANLQTELARVKWSLTMAQLRINDLERRDAELRALITCP